MKKATYSMSRMLFWISLLAIVTSSCVPLKKTVYLQVKESADTVKNFVNERKIDYRIQPGDNLYIRVVTLDEKTNVMLNPLMTGGGGNMGTDAAVYLVSYEVNEAGYLDFPMVGELFVRNMNTDEVSETINERLREYLRELVVIVKLVNFNITVLGEVQRPGGYKVYRSNVNLFEAISLANDMTDFANANRVAIIRQTKTGSTVHMIDMTKRSILASEYYYVRPYDVIYVYPVRGKQFTFANFPYGVVFGFISTTILLLNYLETQ
jgi:polysaccharide export outer membrane protein